MPNVATPAVWPGGSAPMDSSGGISARKDDMQETSRLRTGARRQDVVKLSGTTAEQRSTWRQAARRADMPLACWLREAADAAVLGETTAADLRAEIAKLRLGRGVGNNLADRDRV